MTQAREKGAFKRWGLLVALVLLMAALFFSDAHTYLSLHYLAEERTSLANFVEAYFWQAVLLFFVLYAVSTTLSVPGGAVLTLAAGFLFGVWLGGSIVVLAATLGAIGLFVVAKTSLGEALSARASKHLETLREGFNRNAFYYLLFLRLVPVFPFWLVNLAPALLNVPLLTYTIATLIGIIPGTFAFAFLGAGLDNILVAQEKIYQACIKKQPADTCQAVPALGDLFNKEIIIALCLLSIVALIPILVQRIRGTKA